jgi:hypothetical protein
MSTKQIDGMTEHFRQTKFLAEKGFMTWKQARDLPQAERAALEAEYSKWIIQATAEKNENGH